MPPSAAKGDAPLRILYIPQCPLSWELGGSKVQLALAQELQALGWQSDCLFPFEPGNPQHRQRLAACDVVDWESSHRIQRDWLPSSSLSVCRFPLLTLHLDGGVPWPQPLIRRFDWLLDPLRALSGRQPLGRLIHQAVDTAHQAIAQADAIAIQNSQDRHCLLSYGIPEDQIVQQPCGLRREEREALQARLPACGNSPVLAFLGSFNYLKGCKDLVWLANCLGRRFPTLRIRLIGTNGLMKGEAAVRRFFPGWFQSRLEVIPSFASSALAEQLRGVSLGVFPSYMEGFGIAVIEQLAAGIPVVGYEASGGPADILPPDWLVPRGDRQQLLDRLLFFLEHDQERTAAATRARQISLPYQWPWIARRWDQHYRRLLAARRG